MEVQKLNQINRRNTKMVFIMAVVSLFLVCISLCVGRYDINLVSAIQEIIEHYFGSGEKIGIEGNILLNIRIPRTIAAILVGGALSLSGMTYQSIFRNRLASPDLLGVSTGSCVGAAICIICGLSALQIQFWSFLGGMVTVFFTLLIGKLFSREKGFALILAGVLVGGMMTSILGFIKYNAKPETQLPSIIYWTMGDISSISMQQISYVVLPMIISMILLCVISWRINFFMVSDEVAKSMGINISLLKILCIISATLLTACSVSIAGTISWVGLAMPQMVRFLCGENTKYSLRLSILAGMSFLLFADIMGRIISSAEIPMSVLTGIPGVLIFVLCIYLSNRREKRNV